MINNLFDELNSFFDEVSKGAKEAQKKAKGIISVNVRKNDEGYLVEAFLPGVKKEDVSINYVDCKLEIEVKEHEIERKDYILQERLENYYKREIELSNVDSAGIKAKLLDGILYIALPFVKKESKTINID